MPAPTFSPQRLRALREHRHLSREVLAVRSQKTAGAVEKFERGDTCPSAETLGLLASALDASVADLFDVDPGDPRQRYIAAVCDLLPPMTDDEVEKFAAVIRARRATPKAGRQRRVPV